MKARVRLSQIDEYQLTSEDVRNTNPFDYDVSLAYIKQIGTHAKNALTNNNFQAAIRYYQQQIACSEKLQERNGGLYGCNERYAVAAACIELADIFTKKEWGFNRAEDCPRIVELYKKAIQYVDWDINRTRADSKITHYKAKLKAHLSQFPHEPKVAELVNGDVFLISLFESCGIHVNAFFKPVVKKPVMHFHFNNLLPRRHHGAG
jgi:hypothetical protein